MNIAIHQESKQDKVNLNISKSFITELCAIQHLTIIHLSPLKKHSIIQTEVRFNEETPTRPYSIGK